MQQYLDLLDNILSNGVKKSSGRENMPDVIGISGGTIKMDLSEGFPLLTTKKMYWKGIVHELLWFLRGNTNIKYLVDNNVNIWNGDAYRWYTKWWEMNENMLLEIEPEMKKLSMEEFVDVIKGGNLMTHQWSVGSQGDEKYNLGDLGKVYGHQWRNQNGVDQIADLVDSLQNRPFSRYHILDGWNKVDFNDMALPPCHLLYQFIVRPLAQEERDDLAKDKLGINYMPVAIKAIYGNNIDKFLDDQKIPKLYLDLNMYQRSCDSFLGVPFNLASMSLLLAIFAKVSGMLPGVATWLGGDVHIYQEHIPAIKEQLSRTPTRLPGLEIKKDLKILEDIENLTIEDFDFPNYYPEPPIKAELFTGLKK